MEQPVVFILFSIPLQGEHALSSSILVPDQPTRLTNLLLAQIATIQQHQSEQWQQILAQGESLWLAIPAGYEPQTLMLDPPAQWHGKWPIADLRHQANLPDPLPDTTMIWLANPDTLGEGRLRLQGKPLRRLGRSALEWQLAPDESSELATTLSLWQRRLGSWPLAWTWLLQALTHSSRQDGSLSELLQLWGRDLLSSPVLPAPQLLALILLAPDPDTDRILAFDHQQFATLCCLTPEQAQKSLTQLTNAGWLLAAEEGWQWQPFIAWICKTRRQRGELEWSPLLFSLCSLPLETILALLPTTAQQPAALMIELLPRIGWQCVEQARGRWLADSLFALPLTLRRQHPPLTLLEAWVELEITKHSERACAALKDLNPARLDDTLQQVAQLLLAITDFHFDQVNPASTRLDTLPVLPAPWHTPQRLTQAMCALFTGDTTRAQQILDDIFARAEATGEYHLKLVTANRLAQLHFYRGDWYATERVLRQALDFANEQGLQSDPALDSCYRMLADQALLRGDGEQASRWMENGRPLAASWGEYWSLPYQTQQLLIQLWRNDALDLRQQVGALDERRFSQLYCRQWQFRTGLAIAWGYVRLEARNGLLRLLERSPRHPHCSNLYDLQDNLLHGMLALLCEQPVASDQLTGEARLADEWQCYWLAWQYRLLLLCQQQSEPVAWHELLQEMSGPHSHPVLPFMLLGVRTVAPLQQLCRWSQCSETVLDYARHLLQQLTSPLPQSSTFAGVDGLSQRQQQILRLIAQGLSNEQIAERLFVAPSTIKTHINHLYAKLGVNNRAEAQAVARQRLG